MFGLSRYGGGVIIAELSALLSPLVLQRVSSPPSSSCRLKQGSSRMISILALAGWMVVAAWWCVGVAEGVSMGGHHSCTVLEGGSVKCWGYNNMGQLGLGHNTSWGSSAEHVGNFAEVELGEGFEAAGVTCGLDHSCAWSTTGMLKCWGGNSFGQLGYGDTVNRGDIADSMGDNLTYIQLGTGVGATFAVAANHFTCVMLSDQTIKCFGRNDWGQLGSGNATNNFGDSPNEMGDNLPIVPLVAPGANYTAYELAAYNGPCAVVLSDVAASVALKCWGPNGYGSLGLGDSYNRGDDPNEMQDFLSAVQLGSGQTAESIVMGMDFVCAIVESRQIKCWGRNGNGQCGSGDVETYGNDPDEMGDNLPFVDLGTSRTVVSLTAGEAHLCALLDDASVKCWGKGYYGATGHETWHSTGQIPNQMGDNLTTLDLGTVASDSTSSTSSPGRKLRGLGGVSRRSMQETGTGDTAYQVEYLTAGGQRSCAILDGGVVKCWGRAWAGSLGLGDTVDRGDRPGSMGDNLPTLNLGVGAVAVAPSPAEYVTLPPTPAPTIMQTPTPTLSPTIALTPVPAIATTPSPTTLTSVDLGATSSTSSELDATPSPTTPAPSTVRATTRSGFEGLADDVGVSVTQGIAIAAGMCAALLLLVCCCGYCMAAKRRSRDDKAAAIHSSSASTAGGSRKKDAEGHAAPICPLSASSRNHSRSGSHVNSRAASFYGPDGAESLISDAKEQDEERMQEQLQREQVFCASNGVESVVEGAGTTVVSNDKVFYVEQRGVETKLEDGGGGAAAGGGRKVNGHSKSAVNGGDLGYADGVVFARGVAEEESKEERVRERGDVRDASEAESEGLGSSRNGSLLAGRARSFRNAFIPGSSSSTTPARTRMKSAAAAMTPSYLRRPSSSETPTHTWSGQYQVRPVEGSGSVTPESNAADSTFSQSREGASLERSASQMHHSRNGSAVSSDMVEIPRT